jgi:hypothetical protein
LARRQSIASATGASRKSSVSISPTRSSPTPEHPVNRALTGVFYTLENWAQLDRAIQSEHTSGQHRPLTLAVNWIDSYGRCAEAQIPTRDLTAINSTGPVKQLLREIDRRIRRPGRLLHQPRPAREAA